MAVTSTLSGRCQKQKKNCVLHYTSVDSASTQVLWSGTRAGTCRSTRVVVPATSVQYISIHFDVPLLHNFGGQLLGRLSFRAPAVAQSTSISIPSPIPSFRLSPSLGFGGLGTKSIGMIDRHRLTSGWLTLPVPGRPRPPTPNKQGVRCSAKLQRQRGNEARKRPGQFDSRATF